MRRLAIVTRSVAPATAAKEMVAERSGNSVPHPSARTRLDAKSGAELTGGLDHRLLGLGDRPQKAGELPAAPTWASVRLSRRAVSSEIRRSSTGGAGRRSVRTRTANVPRERPTMRVRKTRTELLAAGKLPKAA